MSSYKSRRTHFYLIHKNLVSFSSIANISYFSPKRRHYLARLSFVQYKLLVFQIQYNQSMPNSYHKGKTFSSLYNKLFQQLTIQLLYSRFVLKNQYPYFQQRILLFYLKLQASYLLNHFTKQMQNFMRESLLQFLIILKVKMSVKQKISMQVNYMACMLGLQYFL